MSRLKKSEIKKKNKKSKLRKNTLIFTLILILFSSIFFTLTFSNNKISLSEDKLNNNNEESVQASTIGNKPSKITISAVGDIMAHNPQLKAQYDSSTNSYSFDNNFKYIKNHTQKSDLAIANLETTLSGTSTPYSSYPSFNTPDAIAMSLKTAGFDILSTINNHSFDKGDLGVERTLSVLDKENIDYIGTRSNINDRNYMIKEINNINLGITSFSYGELKNDSKYVNGIKISNESKDKMNIFDMHDVNNAFNTIKNTLSNLNDTDIQIVILHWGNEYQRAPSEFQTKLAQMLCDYGVDIIIGSHPHVVQPVEMINSTNGENDTLVIYSLGNFLSNQRQELLGTQYTEDGLMVDIEITKNPADKEASVSSVNCIPTWVNKYQGESKLVYEIIPIADKNQLSTIENAPIDKLKSSYKNTASLIKTSPIINIVPNPFE